MRDSMTLNSYSEMKGCKCNTVQKGKKEWVCIILLAKQSHYMKRS